MFRLRRASLAAVACLALVSTIAAQDQVPSDSPTELKALKYRLIGPAAGGRVSRVAGIPGDPTTYYAATRLRRRLEVHRRRRHWSPIFDDQPVSSIGSIAVAQVEPKRRLRRHRRGEHPRQRRAGQRHLQVDRRRQDLEARLEAGRADRHDGRPPDEPRHRLRRRARPRVRPERRARRLPHDRRRQDWQQVLKKDADTGASDVAIDPNNPAILFAGLWQARRRPWEMTSGGPGSGLYVSRDGGDTWKQLTGKGLPGRHLGQGRRRGRAVRRPAGLRADRGREGRPLPLRRRRRELGARSTATARAAPARLVLLDAHRAPDEPDDVWFPQVPLLKSIDGGKTFQLREGRAPRRPPRPLDRPDEPRPHDRRQRRRRGHLDERRRDVVRAAAADRAVLPRDRPTTGCRTASPARCRTAARRRGRATACSGRHRARRLAQRRRRRGRLRRRRPERPGHRLRRRVRRHHHALRPPHRQSPGTSASGPRTPRAWRRGHEVPLPVDRPDPRLAARPQGRSTTARNVLFRTTRRRPDVGRRSAPT